jgi:hypothetical protein
MKVKFYKGPYHGKVQEHQIMSFDLPIIVDVLPKRFSATYFNASTYPTTIQTDRHIYRIRMMGVKDSTGKMYQAPAMHPDGSLFYVYEGKY